MSRNDRERNKRRDRERRAHRQTLSAARQEVPSGPHPESVTTLWHATTTAVVPPSPTSFELQSPAQHCGATVFSADIAPRDLIYLGDGVSLVFAALAMMHHGGDPVILDVEVAWSSLVPDPAYLVARHRLASVGLTGFGHDTVSSLYWSGRVATRGPALIRQRRVCRDLPSFKANLVNAQLPDHAQAWHDARIWRQAAADSGASVSSGAEWRHHLGDVFVRALFRPY